MPSCARRRKPGETPACARWERPCNTAVLLRECTCRFCHVHDCFVARADGLTGLDPGFPGLFQDVGEAVPVYPGGAAASRTCAPGGRPSCCAASPALTASEMSPALSVNATSSPGATAAKVARYGTVSWRRPHHTTS